MITGYVMFEYSNEILDGGDPHWLALVIDERLTEYCTANGLTRLEGPAHRRQDIGRLFEMDLSALFWPVEFPDGEALT